VLLLVEVLVLVVVLQVFPLGLLLVGVAHQVHGMVEVRHLMVEPVGLIRLLLVDRNIQVRFM
jgi:hypothetical protein